MDELNIFVFGNSLFCFQIEVTLLGLYVSAVTLDRYRANLTAQKLKRVESKATNNLLEEIGG